MPIRLITLYATIETGHFRVIKIKIYLFQISIVLKHTIRSSCDLACPSISCLLVIFLEPPSLAMSHELPCFYFTKKGRVYSILGVGVD